MRVTEVYRAIEAPVERVWACLTDAEALVRGGLGITRIEGRIAAGSRLRLWSESAPGRAFALTVTEFSPPTTMRWSSGMPLGLFRGDRSFTLAATPAGCDFHMREVFTGVLLPVIGRFIPDLEPSFRQFAEGLAMLAER